MYILHFYQSVEWWIADAQVEPFTYYILREDKKHFHQPFFPTTETPKTDDNTWLITTTFASSKDITLEC